MRAINLCLLICCITFNVQAKGPKCNAEFVDPISDICWDCIFPITLGSIPLSSEPYPDTDNPKSAWSACPFPPPVFVRIGLNIGYWEPDTLVDVTRIPWCFTSLGFQMSGNKSQQIGGGSSVTDNADDKGFYHAHYYKYPVMSWLKIIESVACVAKDVFDVAYITEIDPLWDDDVMSFILNPEALLFGNPIAQLACIPEAVATSTNQLLPFDILFWCLGSQGSAYPLTGTTDYVDTPLQAATLIMERLNYKLHRQGLILDSRGEDVAVCEQYYSPILPKSRYRYQLTKPVADNKSCHPYGTTSLLWESGKTSTKGEDFGFVNFKKRNCVFL